MTAGLDIVPPSRRPSQVFTGGEQVVQQWMGWRTPLRHLRETPGQHALRDERGNPPPSAKSAKHLVDGHFGVVELGGIEPAGAVKCQACSQPIIPAHSAFSSVLQRPAAARNDMYVTPFRRPRRPFDARERSSRHRRRRSGAYVVSAAVGPVHATSS
jgi:hypothetical protein